MYPLRPARRVARDSLALDVPTEMVIPGVVCVDTVTSATLPVRSRSPVAVLCSFYVDAVTVDVRLQLRAIQSCRSIDCNC